MNAEEEKIKEHKDKILQRANACLVIMFQNGIEDAFISHLCLDRIEIGISQ